MPLYNLKTSNGEYKITKFDEDLNPESSYLVSNDACECPAGHRSTCRHRQMLPVFQMAGRANTRWFFDIERDKWMYLDDRKGLISESKVRRL